MHSMLYRSKQSTQYISTHFCPNFLNIQLIFNLPKVLESWDWGLFNHTIKYYICQYCQYKTRISNTFNAIYVDTVNTKHIHTFLPITFLIFNRFSICKNFGKLRLMAFQPYHQILYMLILLILGISISNAFNAIYVKAVNTFSTQWTHM